MNAAEFCSRLQIRHVCLCAMQAWILVCSVYRPVVAMPLTWLSAWAALSHHSEELIYSQLLNSSSWMCSAALASCSAWPISLCPDTGNCKIPQQSETSKILGNLRDLKSPKFHQKAKLAMHGYAATQVCCVSLSSAPPEVSGIHTQGIPALKTLGSLIQQAGASTHPTRDFVVLTAFWVLNAETLPSQWRKQFPPPDSETQIQECFIHRRCFPLHVKLDCCASKLQVWRERKQTLSHSLVWFCRESSLQNLWLYFAVSRITECLPSTDQRI